MQGEDLFGQDGQGSPAVLRPEHVDDDDKAELRPETVYLPSTERITDRYAEVTLELRALEDGTVAMLAFTSLEQLVACCGDGQPWVAVRDFQVEDLQRVSGAEIVVWDAALPLNERKTRFAEGN